MILLSILDADSFNIKPADKDRGVKLTLNAVIRKLKPRVAHKCELRMSLSDVKEFREKVERYA